ncbi:MAG: NAD(P)/FAD-dependent oxidoreductase, partial [Myxococcales bacterium]|nr:NAD(P)/FAD-dependent oxidoreductase [Myxococcales bacterium]
MSPAPDLDVAIVGAGFAGLGLAARLTMQGGRRFRVFEAADDLGGTWRDNHYPGAACDVPSHLYSFSFAPHHGWTRSYAPQGEILAYLHHVADTFGLRRHIRFGCRAVAAD